MTVQENADTEKNEIYRKIQEEFITDNWSAHKCV